MEPVHLLQTSVLRHDDGYGMCAHVLLSAGILFCQDASSSQERGVVSQKLSVSR